MWDQEDLAVPWDPSSLVIDWPMCSAFNLLH